MMDVHAQYLLGALLFGLTIHFFFWMGFEYILALLKMIGPGTPEKTDEPWTQSMRAFFGNPWGWLGAIMRTRRSAEHDPRYQNLIRKSRICLVLCATFFLPTAVGTSLLFSSSDQCMAQHDETSCRF